MKDYTKDVTACICWFIAAVALIFAMFFGIGLFEPGLRPPTREARQVWFVGSLVVMVLLLCIAEWVLSDEDEQSPVTGFDDAWLYYGGWGL